MPIHSSSTGWILETRNTAYALGLNQSGLLTLRYWGARLPLVNDYPAPINPVYWAADGPSHFTPEEFPGYGGTKYIDPALKVTLRMACVTWSWNMWTQRSPHHPHRRLPST